MSLSSTWLKRFTAACRRSDFGGLNSRLGETERWDHVLSVGEQQRLAFARLLLHKPDWVFMDEATSVLDEDMHTSLVNLLTSGLRGATLVSIAHRPGLGVFHDRTLTLVEAVEGARLVTKRKPPSVHEGQRRCKLSFTEVFRAFDSGRLH
jgi:vitamin B12/bleomycin/antimicrobial peptide transport system ATP-binding/permease protein